MTPAQFEEAQLGAVLAFLILGGCAVWWTVCVLLEGWQIRQRRRQAIHRLEELVRHVHIDVETDLAIRAVGARFARRESEASVLRLAKRS